MYGLTRGTMTLIGAAAAGLLLWLASQTDTEALGGYWTWIGLLAGAGLVMALSQLLGGWTKWGWPRLTATVFLLGFLPALVVGGLVLLQAQPEDAFGQGWAADLGVESLAEDLISVLPALAFGLGLLFGFTFDTTGPRQRVEQVDTVEHRDVRRTDRVGATTADGRPIDEPVTAERRHVAYRNDGGSDVADDDRVATGSRVDRDADGVDDRDEAARARDSHRR